MGRYSSEDCIAENLQCDVLGNYFVSEVNICPHSLRIKVECLIFASVIALCLLSGHVIKDTFSHIRQTTMSPAWLVPQLRSSSPKFSYGQGGWKALWVRSERGRQLVKEKWVSMGYLPTPFQFLIFSCFYLSFYLSLLIPFLLLFLLLCSRILFAAMFSSLSAVCLGLTCIVMENMPYSSMYGWQQVRSCQVWPVLDLTYRRSDTIWPNLTWPDLTYHNSKVK